MLVKTRKTRKVETLRVEADALKADSLQVDSLKVDARKADARKESQDRSAASYVPHRVLTHGAPVYRCQIDGSKC